MPFKVTIAQSPVSVEFEAGSIGEATAILSDNASSLAAMFAVDVTGETGGAPAEPAKPRGRPRSKNQPDPATAHAPPPLAVAPPAPPVPAAQGDTGIPAFLDRNKPPPLPNAPPVAPAPPPPSGALASAVVAEVKKRTAGSPDGGKAMVTWLVQCGAVVDGATLDEAMACLPLIEAGKLGQIAAGLQVSV